MKFYAINIGNNTSITDALHHSLMPLCSSKAFSLGFLSFSILLLLGGLTLLFYICATRRLNTISAKKWLKEESSRLDLKHSWIKKQQYLFFDLFLWDYFRYFLFLGFSFNLLQLNEYMNKEASLFEIEYVGYNYNCTLCVLSLQQRIADSGKGGAGWFEMVGSRVVRICILRIR